LIKHKPTYPFETVAIAIAFSPRAKEILIESKIIAEKFSAKLLLIHAGEQSDEKKNRLLSMTNEIGIDINETKVIWKKGPIVDVILSICKAETVDLLILGALQEESLYQYYMGSVARKLCRKAECSLLMITEPKETGQKFNNIIVNGIQDIKTPKTVETALYFSSKTNVKNMTIVGELNTKELIQHDDDKTSIRKLNKTRGRTKETEIERFQSLTSNYQNTYNCTIDHKFIFGKAGHSIGMYAQTIRADLLVLNSPNKTLSFYDRLFPHDIEYILGDMPCNLLIVHSRNNEG
jgi:hypothetical protein